MKKTLSAIVIVIILTHCHSGNYNSNQSQSGLGKETAYGIDVSQFQGRLVSSLNKENDSLDFIICKATEGITLQDTSFVSNWKTIKSKGFIRGCYHFYHCQDNISLQADNYLNTVKGFDSEDLPPIVDFEETSLSASCNSLTIQTELLNFLDTLKQRTGRKPIIYTNPDTADKYLNNTRFSDYALWISDPGSGAGPAIPETWKSKGWVIWQKSFEYTSATKVTSDFDVFNGDRDSLISFIKNYGNY